MSTRGNMSDQPWSWVVAVACAWNFLWAALLKRPGALIFAALVTDHGVSREQAAWILTISTTMACLIGPVVGLLTKCFSTKALSIFGSLLFSVSTILCFLSTDFVVLLILLGICNGIGIGIAMFMCDIVINQYFVRYRASATGICYSGGTLAAFAFPPLLLKLINHYGLQGALLISGGLSLNALAGSLLFAAPPRANDSWDQRTEVSTVASSLNSLDTAVSVPQLHTQPNCPAEDATTKRNSIHRSEGPNNAYLEKGCTDLHREGGGAMTHSVRKGSAANGFKTSGSTLPRKTYQTFTTSRGLQDQSSSATRHKNWASHLNFLRFPAFYLIMLSGLSITYTMFTLVILVDFVEEKGIDKERGAVMLSVTAIGDAAARLLSGTVSDRGVLDRRTVIAASSVLAGAICIALPSVDSYPVLVMLSVLFGWAIGSALVLMGPIMADTVGVQNLGVAMGISRFAVGAASFGGPKLAGYFKDSIGSYTGLFYVTSAGCLLVASAWFAEAVRLKLRGGPVKTDT